MRLNDFKPFLYRLARDEMNENLEKQFGTTDVASSDRPTLEVRIPDALPEAFEKVLHYIYTDRIDCELIFFIWCHFYVFVFNENFVNSILFSFGSNGQQRDRTLNDGYFSIGCPVFDYTFRKYFDSFSRN